MVPAPIRIPDRSPRATTVQRRTSWGIEIGGLRIGFTRTRETYSMGPAFPPAREPAPRTGWGVAAGVFAALSTLGLVVVGASASRPALTARYAVTLPVPEVAAPRVVRPAARAPHPGRSARLAAPLPAADGFDAADMPYVARALETGAFQEWQDGEGRRRYLTAGPARIEGGKACRTLALLVRAVEGGSHVKSVERCTDAPVTDVATPPAADTDGQAVATQE